VRLRGPIQKLTTLLLTLAGLALIVGLVRHDRYRSTEQKLLTAIPSPLSYPPASAEGTNLIMSLGPDAIPVLLDWSMVQSEPPLEQWVRQIRKRLNKPPSAPFAPINWTNEQRARIAFSILRDRAVAAVPELQGRLSHTNSDVRRFSVQILGAIGPAIGKEAFKRMTNCLSDPDQEVRNDVIWSLQFHRPEEYPPEMLIPVYLAGLRDSYHIARENAFTGLKRLGTNALPFKQAIEDAEKKGDPIF
jgi:hypothetical protein